MAAEVEASAAQAEEADFTAEKPADSDSSDSDDGMPPLDGYWSAMLNVTNTAKPVKPQLLLKPKLDEERKGRGRGKGVRGKGKGAKSGFGGMQPVGMFPMFDPLDPFSLNGHNGWKGGKGSWRRAVGCNPNDIGDFIAWAQDENAGDGSRPLRERSRSPIRQPASLRLENFLEWARDPGDAKEEPRQQEEAGGGLSSFMAWASGIEEEREAEARARLPNAAVAEVAEEIAQGLAAKAEPGVGVEVKAAPPVRPTAPGELIVPKELEEELRAMGGDGTGAGRRTKSEERSDDED